MEIVADESVDFGIVKKLRENNFSVFAISENNQGINDEEVLEIAYNKNAILLTEDKDFGELTHRLQLKHKGLLLIRLSGLKRDERIKTVCETIKKYQNRLADNFSVINENGLRIKPKLSDYV